MADENYQPDESKKQPLWEIFHAAVWAPLIGDKDFKAAQEAGLKAGVTEKDLEAISTWNAKQCKAYFGDAAFDNRDFINAMKACDAVTSISMGGWGAPGPMFKKAGFYS
jgi:hypothetical protein